MIITLSWTEMLISTYVGTLRQISNIKNNRQPRYGAAEVDGAWDKHIVSCQAEMSVAKMLNIFWSGAINDLKAADVGRHIEVRSTTHPTGRLILHREDDDDHVFYLVRARPPQFDVVGWIAGSDGKQEKFWQALPHHTPPRPAFFVPDVALHLCAERRAA